MGECLILIGLLKRWNPFLQLILNSWQFFISIGEDDGYGMYFVHPGREKFLIISKYFYVNGATWVND